MVNRYVLKRLPYNKYCDFMGNVQDVLWRLLTGHAEYAAGHLNHADKRVRTAARGRLMEMVTTWNYYFHGPEGHSSTDTPPAFPSSADKGITWMDYAELNGHILSLEIDDRNLSRMERVLISVLGNDSTDPLLALVRAKQMVVSQKIRQARAALMSDLSPLKPPNMRATSGKPVTGPCKRRNR